MVPSALPSVWILTDGKAGDEQPLIGLAEAMGATVSLRHVAPRRPFSWLMPWGPIDPKDASEKPGSPLGPPFPDICLATGRRATAYLRKLKSLSPETFCVFWKDPRIRKHRADLLVVQQHDKPRGGNVLVVTTAPNRISPARLETARRALADRLGSLPSPRVAVLVGGDSRHHQFSKDDIERFLGGLEAKLDAGNALMMTGSRRTPPPLAMALGKLAKRPNVFFWDGSGDNPLLAYLAWADEIVVTADSTNMVGEAAALGVPVHVFHPSGGHAKIDRFLEALSQEATIGCFPETQAAGGHAPVNSTPKLAREILARWQDFRSPPAPPSSPAGS